MSAVTVSPEYQIVIPEDIREAMNIKPGQKIELVRFGDHVHFVPVRPIEDARGMFKGAKVTIERDDEDRV